MRSLVHIAVQLLICATFDTNALAQGTPQLADVKKMIDSHFTQLRQLSHQNVDIAALNKSLEEMAKSEAAVWDKLSDSDRNAAKMYAEHKIKPSSSVRKYLLSKAPPSKAKPTNLGTGEAATGGPCQIVGFIVCYRKCCANGAGNGVAACVGGVTCQNCWSESCPP